VVQSLDLDQSAASGVIDRTRRSNDVSPAVFSLLPGNELNEVFRVATRRSIPVSTTWIDTIYALTALLILEHDPRRNRVVRDLVVVLVCGVVSSRWDHVDNLSPFLIVIPSARSVANRYRWALWSAREIKCWGVVDGDST
jgi:hypothetical protein